MPICAIAASGLTGTGKSTWLNANAYSLDKKI